MSNPTFVVSFCIFFTNSKASVTVRTISIRSLIDSVQFVINLLAKTIIPISVKAIVKYINTVFNQGNEDNEKENT